MKIVLDLEIYPNFFMLGLKDYVTGDTSYFEVSDYKDDRRKLYQWLCTYRGYVISFNGISYDNMVLAFIKKEWSILCNHPDFCLEVKNFSDKVIDSESNFEYLKPYRYTFQKQWVDVDLYLYWSKNLRLSKKVSLKGLGIQMGYPVVQELPYPPHQHLTKEQIEEVKNYNLQHDLGITRLLAKQFTGQGHVSIGNLGTIQLRQFITRTYGINAMSMDGPKIASEILLQNYCRITGKNLQEVRDLRFPSETIYFGEILKDIPVNFKNPILQKVHQEWLKAVGSFSKEFVLLGNHPIKISVGQGGIHSINKNEIYIADDDHLIITDDIGAMYPTNIENWKAFRFSEIQQSYVEFKEKRIKETKPGMKQYPKGSPEWNKFYQKDSFYKLILNGVSGLLDMTYSWMYNHSKIMKVRCGGQLILLSLIDRCLEHNIKVISVNTDGLEVICSKNQYETYLKLVEETEKQFNVTFERDFYQRIIYQNVNSYIAETTSGKLKKKGMFVTDPDLGNSVDFLVIPKCLELYFIKGIKPEIVLSDPEKYNLHIYDFCCSAKVDRSYTVEWYQKPQQRLNRFYVSKNGAYIYKCRNGKKTHMLKGWGVTLYNNHIEQPFKNYKINKSFYLNEINTLIKEIENYNQYQLL